MDKKDTETLKKTVLWWIQKNYQLAKNMTIKQIQALVILQQIEMPITESIFEIFEV